MTEKSNPKDLVEFVELLNANSMQFDALSQLLIEKGLITSDELFDKLNDVQLEGHVRNLIRGGQGN